jgi:protein O-mannosyl-transferase
MSKIHPRQIRHASNTPAAAAAGAPPRSATAGAMGRSPLIVLSLLAVVLVVYWPATTHEFLNYDDNLYVTDNPPVRQGLTLQGIRWAFGALHAANWHPLTWLSHMLDTTLFGMKPWGHHLTNVLFHAANAVLLFAWLWRMTRAQWRSAMVAALFALHPLHVESVAWVAERKDVLSTFFGFLSLLCYAGYARKRRNVEGRMPGATPAAVPGSRSWRVDYALALLFFALGLLSKPMLVTWPFVMLLLDYWPLRRFDPPTSDLPPHQTGVVARHLVAGWRLVREKIPFLILSLASSVVTVIAQSRGQAVLSLDQLPFGERVQNALVSYARYLGSALWPVDLAVPYPFPERWPAVVVIASALLMVGLCAGAVRLRRRWPFLFVGWFLFLGMLIPVIGLLQVGAQAMADRYTYVPLTGIFIVGVWGLGEVLARWRLPWLLVWSGAGILLVMCGMRAANQLECWHDDETLIRHTITATGNNAFACYDLGCYLENQGRISAAMEYYRLAVQYRPNYAKPLNNIGKILAGEGHLDEAMEYYNRALRINPNYPAALNNLGAALASQRQFAQAISLYEKVLRLDADYPDAHFNLGLALAAVGRADEAIDQYRLALQLRPRFPEAHNGLGIVLLARNRPEEAITHYTEALRLRPDYGEAHNNLGYVLMLQRRLDEAVAHFNESLRLNPRQLTAQFNLGNALAMQQKYEEAAAHFGECLRLSPDYAPAHKNLGMALARLGRREEAVGHLHEALRLKPDYEEAKQQLRVLSGQAQE